MTGKYGKILTEDQRQQMKPTLDKIEQSFVELSSRLVEMGHVPNDELDTHCFFCGCQSYVAGGRRPLRPCGRPGCGHSFIAHQV